MALRLQPSTTFTTTIQDSSTANRSITWPNSNGVVASIVNSTSFKPNITSAHTANRTITLPDRDCELTDGLRRISDTPEILINRSSINFNIPTYAKYACIVYNDISTQSSGFPLIRLTPSSGGTVTTGYTSSTALFRSAPIKAFQTRTDGFALTAEASSIYFYTGVCELYNFESNIWTCSILYKVYQTSPSFALSVGQTIGNISLATNLITVNLVMSASDIFDSGTANAFYK